MDWYYPGVEQLSDGPFRIWTNGDNKEWADSLEHLAQYIRTEGPFDGVYGFSQGVALLTEFSHLSIWKDRFGFRKCPWKFAILACGGASDALTLSVSNHKGAIDLPSLHIFGKYDMLRPDSQHLAQLWKQTSQQTYTHQSGHEIDMKMVQREPKLGQVVKDFLKKHHSSTTRSR